MGNHSHDRKQRRSRERNPGGADEGARLSRLQELIREEVNFLLRGEIRDRRLDDVYVTIVELMGESARVWYSAAGDDDELEALEGAAGFLRSRIAESLGLKRTPELRFRRDPATRAFAATPGAEAMDATEEES